jgi:hypothetical protein
LINRCSAGGCHGAQSPSALQILKPIAGQMMQKRATQRNLFTALKYVDREHPEQSKLLTLPAGKHGGSEPLFDTSSKDQLAALKAWVDQVNATTGNRPSSIKPAMTNLASPGGTTDPAATKQGTSPITANVSPPENPVKKPAEAPERSPDGVFRPRDSFDPEIFHRRVQKEKKLK